MSGKTLRKEGSFGSCEIDHLSPPRAESWPKAINIFLGFEEALKLQPAIQARLMDINRGTPGLDPRGQGSSTGSRSPAVVNLCVHIQSDRLTVTGGSVK